MVGRWSNWKRFPVTLHAAALEVPAGPGVYEVRHALSGRLVAFGHSANVAGALAAVVPGRARRIGRWLTGRETPDHRPGDLEYRIFPVGSRTEARDLAQSLNARRHAYWRRRTSLRWA